MSLCLRCGHVRGVGVDEDALIGKGGGGSKVMMRADTMKVAELGEGKIGIERLVTSRSVWCKVLRKDSCCQKYSDLRAEGLESAVKGSDVTNWA